MKVEPVFETRGYNETYRQTDGYYQGNRGQNKIYWGSQGKSRIDCRKMTPKWTAVSTSYRLPFFDIGLKMNTASEQDTFSWQKNSE